MTANAQAGTYMGGGGGRIAVWRMVDTSPGLVAATAAGGGTNSWGYTNNIGADGTVVWGLLPLPRGTLISVR